MTSNVKGTLRGCVECGETFDARREDADFCSRTCRSTFNNRRAMRGAELYDLFMTMRHDRKLTSRMKKDGFNIWTLACRLATRWKEEDERDRKGRRSWLSVPRMKANGRFAWLTSMLVGVDKTGQY